MRARVPALGVGRPAARGDRRRPRQPALVVDRSQDHTQQAGRVIQGRKASGAEWATYVALRALGWDDSDIAFQVPVFGGRRQAGGQVLDFIIRTRPAPVVVDVRGEHWHASNAARRARDTWREIQLAASPESPRVVVVWEEIARDMRRLRALLLRDLGAK